MNVKYRVTLDTSERVDLVSLVLEPWRMRQEHGDIRVVADFLEVVG